MSKVGKRHYRRYDGLIACGLPASYVDSTSVEEGVTCKNCLVQLKKGGAS